MSSSFTPPPPLENGESEVIVNLDGPSGRLPSSMALLLFAASSLNEPGYSYKAQAFDSTGKLVSQVVLWPAEKLYESETGLADSCLRQDLVFRLVSRRRYVERVARRQPLGLLLWQAGAMTSDSLLPWLNVSINDHFSISSWPEIPHEARTPEIARCLARLSRASLTINELCSLLGVPRVKVISLLNAIAMQSRLQQGRPSSNPFSSLDFEQALFMGSLFSKIAEIHQSLSEKER